MDALIFVLWAWVLIGLTASTLGLFIHIKALRAMREARSRKNHPAGKKIGRVTSVEMKDDGLYANFELDAEHGHLLEDGGLKNISVGGFDVPVVRRDEPDLNIQQYNPIVGLLGMAPNEKGEIVPHGDKNFKWGRNRNNI